MMMTYRQKMKQKKMNLKIIKKIENINIILYNNYINHGKL